MIKLELDIMTKAIVIILLVVIAYVMSLAVLTPLFIPQSSSRDMMGMMRYLSNPYYGTISSVASLVPALIVGLMAAFYIKTKKEKEPREVSEYKVLKRALSEDEDILYNEIKKARKITQDSLRFRLDWSKAKVSRILTNLDKMNLIQRERAGKTYNVFLERRK